MDSRGIYRLANTMDYYQIIAERFQGTLESVAMSVDQLAGPIGQASELLTGSLLQDRKIIVCGSGVDAALAQLFTTCLMDSLDHERPALPALNISGDGASLSAIGESEGNEARYSRQVQAMGQPGDTLLLINSGEAGPALAAALRAALERDMQVALLTRSADRLLPPAMPTNGATVTVEATVPSRALEIHTMILLALCQLIEFGLFGPRE